MSWYFRDKRPTSKYKGVYPSYQRKDGTIVWRAMIKGHGMKLRVLGSFEDEEEAYKAICKFAEREGLTLNTKHKTLSEEDKEFVREYSNLLSAKGLSTVLNTNTRIVQDFIKREGVSEGTDAFIIVDKRGNYED